MLLEFVFFGFFSLLTIGSSLMVIQSSNPVHSVLYLILAFCNTSILLILLGAEFIAMIFLVVYVGAIAVLFLFVVMMLNVQTVELKERSLKYLPIGFIVILLVFFELITILYGSNVSYSYDSSGNNWHNFTVLEEWYNNIYTVTNVEAIGQVLYTHYSNAFLISSLVLLVAMIGAIVLTMHQKGYVRRQVVYEQTFRNFEKTIQHIEH